MRNQYYSMEKVGNEATISIYGDITSEIWQAGDTSSAKLSQQLDALGDVAKINVYINSYGGEVAEGLAIYNALKRHKAKVVTYCDGFAASIASVIFMAGDERIMNDSSLLMIHNAWTFADGNAEQLRKLADDLDKITQASVTAYMAHSTLSEAEIKDLMDKETWILPDEALEYGFATSVEKTEKRNANQSAKMRLLDIVRAYRQATDEQEADEDEEEPRTDEEETEVEEAEAGAEDEEETADTEEEDTEEETPEEDPPDDGEEDQAEQRLNKFFNAILKM